MMYTSTVPEGTGRPNRPTPPAPPPRRFGRRERRRELRTAGPGLWATGWPGGPVGAEKHLEWVVTWDFMGRSNDSNGIFKH